MFTDDGGGGVWSLGGKLRYNPYLVLYVPEKTHVETPK